MRIPIMKMTFITILAHAIFFMGCSRTVILFEDSFDSNESYFESLTQNATHKKYGDNALSSGHLLKKWNYSWDYSYDGDWTQAFYIVPDDAAYMEQAGRSAAPGNYRLITKTSIPESTKQYEITFRQFKNDNDPIFYHLGADAGGDGGVKFGYMNQVPETDSTVNKVYMLGDLGEDVIDGKSYFRQWVDHKISVNTLTKEITWIVNDEVICSRKTEKLRNGGHFALSQKYERGTKYDDFKIVKIR